MVVGVTELAPELPFGPYEITSREVLKVGTYAQVAERFLVDVSASQPLTSFSVGVPDLAADSQSNLLRRHPEADQIFSISADPIVPHVDPGVIRLSVPTLAPATETFYVIALEPWVSKQRPTHGRFLHRQRGPADAEHGQGISTASTRATHPTAPHPSCFPRPKTAKTPAVSPTTQA